MMRIESSFPGTQNAFLTSVPVNEYLISCSESMSCIFMAYRQNVRLFSEKIFLAELIDSPMESFSAGGSSARSPDITSITDPCHVLVSLSVQVYLPVPS